MFLISFKNDLKRSFIFNIVNLLILFNLSIYTLPIPCKLRNYSIFCFNIIYILVY